MNKGENMSNSLDTILNALTSNDTEISQITKLINTLSEQKAIKSAENTDNVTNRFQLKINLINSVIPLLDDNAKQMAEFLIKLLTIISTLQQLKNGEN